MHDFYIDERTALLLKKYPERLHDILTSLSKNQQTCKKWLMKELLHVQLKMNLKPFEKISIVGGWYGNIIIPLIQKHLSYNEIRFYDIDAEVIRLAKNFLHIEGDISFRTQDATSVHFTGHKNLVINTSAEHMAPLTVQKSLMCIQSNNYREIEEHTHCVDSAEELAEMYGMNKLYYTGQIDMGKYTRFMAIGRQSENTEQ